MAVITLETKPKSLPSWITVGSAAVLSVAVVAGAWVLADNAGIGTTSTPESSITAGADDPTGLGAALGVVNPTQALLADPAGLGAALAVDSKSVHVVPYVPAGLDGALAIEDATPEQIVDSSGLGHVFGVDLTATTEAGS